jgi:D-beta-D-heptose 7-phosphate kinase/D-beta-D-heptose 1-phosphate adenosyltransferase
VDRKGRSIVLIQDLSGVFETIHERWSRLRILVVGDVMLDKYVWGDVVRVSPEAPVPIVRAIQRSEAPGGAANVAMNLAGLGVQVAVAGIVGSDVEHMKLDELLKSAGIDANLVETPDLPTTSKTRIIGGHQQLLRLDVESMNCVPDDVYDELSSLVDPLVKKVDAIVISDYAKGALSTQVCRRVIEGGRSRGIPVLVGPKGRDLSRYSGALTICPNLNELKVAMDGLNLSVEELFKVAQSRISELGLQYITVTMGERGIAILRESSVVHAPACAKEVFDVSGGGDTVIAVIAAALSSGLSIEIAIELANLAAGVVIGKLGTVPIHRNELLAQLSIESQGHPQEKILDRLDLKERVAGWKARGNSVVFTNGCFDLLHYGHVMLLEAAHREGARLIVAINSDDSVRRLKGPNRPVIGQFERARMLAALETVDAVTVFDEDTPLGYILELRPDVIVKGGDYTESEVVGGTETRLWNGRVKIVPVLPGFSTTNLIARIGDKRSA